MTLGEGPAANIQRLRPADQIDFNAAFGSASSDREWPEVAARIDEILPIEDGRTGGVNPGDRRALYYLTRWLKPARVLKIGTHVGASTLHIAAALRHQALAMLTTVDTDDVNGTNGPWKGAVLARSPREALAALGADVNFVCADSISFFGTRQALFELIFLDGDHTRETVRAEIALELEHLKQNGLILLHDYFPGGRALWEGKAPIVGPYAAVRDLQRDGVSLTAVPLGALPWPTKHGTNLTSLAALLAA